MAPTPTTPSQPLNARGLLSLARSDKRAAERAAADLTLDLQIALVCDAPADQRARLQGTVA